MYAEDEKITLNGRQLNEIIDLVAGDNQKARTLKLIFNERLYLSKIVKITKELDRQKKLNASKTKTILEYRTKLDDMEKKVTCIYKQVEDHKRMSFQRGQVK